MDTWSSKHTKTQQASPWQSAINLQYQSHAFDPNLGNWTNSPDHERTLAASGLLHLNLGGLFTESARITLPNSATIYPNSSNTTPGEAGEEIAQKLTPPDAAFSRWFSLLTGDNTSPIGGELSFEADDSNTNHNYTTSPTQHDSVFPQDEPCIHFVANRELTSTGPCPSSNRESDTASAVVPNHPSRRQPWQGSEPSKLNSQEQALFENYVNHTSTWVRSSCEFSERSANLEA